MLTSRQTKEDPAVQAVIIEDLELRPGDSSLFTGLNLSLDAGEKVVLTAPSGFGKSTLLRCLLGFVPIVSGTIHIFGSLLTPRLAWQLRTRMAYVDQEPDLGENSVDRFLAQPFSYKMNKHLRPDADRIRALMSQLHLPHSLLSKKATTLSGGEKQRVALIGALLLNRDLLLMDEPTSALDQETAGAVAQLLITMKGLTVLAISHDRSLVDMFDRSVDLTNISRRPG